jgi:hypothetical protein
MKLHIMKFSPLLLYLYLSIIDQTKAYGVGLCRKHSSSFVRTRSLVS